MKALLVAIGAAIALNLFAVLGFVGWLGASGRLSSDRVHKAVALFEPTLAQQKAADTKAAKDAAAAKEKQREAARLASVANGPTTVENRLQQDQQANDLALERVSRMKSDVSALRDEIQRAKQHLAEQQQQLDQKQKEFEHYVALHQKKLQSQQFQRAVQMYENLQPQQAKLMFQQLIAQHKTDQVVDYLNAMQVRKAAKVIQQFQNPQDIDQATMLLQKLRERGSDPMGTQTAHSNSGSNGGQM